MLPKKYVQQHLTKMSKNSISLPKWDQLLDAALEEAQAPHFSEQVYALRKQPRKVLFECGRMIAFLTARDPTYRKFIHSSWSEVVDIIASQIAENKRLATKPHLLSQQTPRLSTLEQQCNRKFQQQPCTQNTVLQRVNYLETICTKDCQIALIGDDDAVCLELEKRGFQNLTVIDIDSDLLAQLKAQSNSYHTIDFVQLDIKKPIPARLRQKDYAAILLDPIYSVPGIEFFLQAALKLTESSSAPHFFLSVHLMSLFKKGMAEFDQLIDSQNLELADFQRSFNVYPIPQKTRHIISLVNRAVTKSPILDPKATLYYFTSDALLLRPKQ